MTILFDLESSEGLARCIQAVTIALSASD